jgi:hypothetical protein
LRIGFQAEMAAAPAFAACVISVGQVAIQGFPEGSNGVLCQPVRWKFAPRLQATPAADNP